MPGAPAVPKTGTAGAEKGVKCAYRPCFWDGGSSGVEVCGSAMGFWGLEGLKAAMRPLKMWI